MAGSPFMPDEEILLEGEGVPDARLPSDEERLKKQRLDAALELLATAGPLALGPIGGKVAHGAKTLGGKVMGAMGVGVGAGAAHDYLKKNSIIGEAQGQTPAHEMQKMLKELGLYSGPMDGTFKPGGPTEQGLMRARKQYGQEHLRDLPDYEFLKYLTDPSTKARIDRALEGKRAGELKKGEQAIELKKQERLGVRDKQIGKATEQAGSWEQTLWNYAPWLVGAGLGIGGGLSTSMPLNRALRGKATEANEFARRNFRASPTTTAASLNDDVGNVNAWWSKGRGVEPFEHTSGRAPPFASRGADAPPAGDLYKRGAVDNAKQWGLKDAPMVGLGAADYIGSGMRADYLKGEADAAGKRFKETDLTADRISQMENQSSSNFWTKLQSGALPYLSAYMATRLKVPIREATPNTASVARATGQRGAVDRYLAQYGGRAPPAPGGGPQQALPAPQPPLQGGPLQAQPVPPQPGGLPPAVIHPPANAHLNAAKSHRVENFKSVFGGGPKEEQANKLVERFITTNAINLDGTPHLTVRMLNQMHRMLENKYGLLSRDMLRKRIEEVVKIVDRLS